MPRKLSKSKCKNNRISPYIVPQSPRVRKLCFEQGHKDISLTLEQLSAELKSIANHPWQVYRLSPLFDLIYDRQKFAEYEKHLLLYIIKEQKKNPDTTNDQNESLKVKLSVKNDFRVIRDDPKAVKIEVMDKTDLNNVKILFLGYLLSVERKEDPYEQRFKNSKLTVLPLFLASGKQFFTKVVTEFLTEKFCCYISPLHFTSLQLAWMISMWAGYQAESGLKPLFLEYAGLSKNLSAIQFSIDSKSIFEIWTRIHDPSEKEMTVDQVNLFLNCLSKHFKALFKFDLDNFQLVSIGTSVAAVRGNGKIKMFCASALPYVLRHLTHLAQEFI